MSPQPTYYHCFILLLLARRNNGVEGVMTSLLPSFHFPIIHLPRDNPCIHARRGTRGHQCPVALQCSNEVPFPD